MLIFQDGIIFDDPLKDYYKTYMSLIAVLTIIITANYENPKVNVNKI